MRIFVKHHLFEYSITEIRNKLIYNIFFPEIRVHLDGPVSGRVDFVPGRLDRYALLIQHGIFSHFLLKYCKYHGCFQISPQQKSIVEENKRLIELVKKRVAKAEVISTGNLADSSLSTASTAMLANNEGPERMETNVTVSAVSFGAASQSQNAEDTKLAGTQFEEVRDKSFSRRILLLHIALGRDCAKEPETRIGLCTPRAWRLEYGQATPGSIPRGLCNWCLVRFLD